VAAWVQDMFCYLYSVKSHKIANITATTEAREKICSDLESLNFLKLFDTCLTKLENYQILLNKLATGLVTTEQFSR
jgi:hypothetical protein